LTEDLLNDEYFMAQAMKEAQKAFDAGEIPVGAVMVAEKRIIARAHNQTEVLNDPTAHAEMLAVTAATHYLGAKYLTDCTLYVTLEPCGMCAGALYWAQLKRLVFAAEDEKRGYRSINPGMVHPRTDVSYGPMGDEASALVSEFFRKLRG
jgi:tRNA(adenine34) deaminase